MIDGANAWEKFKAITFPLISPVTFYILITSLIKGEGLFNEHFGLLVWFFIWELLDLIVYERRDLQEEKMAAAQLASIIVTFREEFVDEPFDEEEQQIYDLLEEEGL